jgi:hypothetical protein
MRRKKFGKHLSTCVGKLDPSKIEIKFPTIQTINKMEPKILKQNKELIEKYKQLYFDKVSMDATCDVSFSFNFISIFWYLYGKTRKTKAEFVVDKDKGIMLDYTLDRRYPFLGYEIDKTKLIEKLEIEDDELIVDPDGGIVLLYEEALVYLSLNLNCVNCIQVSTYLNEIPKDVFDMLYSAIEYSMMPAVLEKVENQVKLAYITPRGDISNQEIKFNDIIDEESVKANYNDDLPYDKLKEILSNDGKALLMFYGEAGTGKTTLIKHFINKIYKNFIFFDANLIMSISNIGLINFLMENTDSVIIFEDCEKIIKSREASDNPFISTLLNLTDGIIADAFRCKFICTFNTSINEVDKALLRKGRLTLQYEFKKLSLDKTKALKPDATSPMTLADIYNEEDNGTKVKGKIGF